MSFRKFGAVLGLIACISFLAVPVAASAQTAPTSEAVSNFSSIPVYGKASNGKAFKHGRFSVHRFVTRNGKTYALGALSGTIGHRSVHRSNVAILMTRQMNTGQAIAAQACQILHLTLGPLDLNLLGLHVHLNRIVLDITAEPGNGNLLGNLLCDVANLLNNTPLLQQQLTSLLNILQQLLGTSSLLGL
jgi:hypothetical protein